MLSEVRAWLDENVIGARPLDDDLKARAEQTVREMIAKRAGCDPERVEFMNPRWEGAEFVADGYTFPLERVHVTFTIA